MPSPFLPIRWLIDSSVIVDPHFFPLLPGQTFLIEKGPQWSTRVQTSKSGRELRSSAWSAPIWNFKVAYELLRDRQPTFDELNRLYAFFNERKGRFGEFFYLDPSEAPVVDQFLGYGDGTNSLFQLTRNLAGWVEPVYAVAGIPVIKVNGVEATASIGEFGVATLTTAPAAGQQVTWSGLAAYICRFDQDNLSPSQMVKDIWELDGLSFKSIKP